MVNPLKITHNKREVSLLILGILLVLIMTLFPYDFFFLESGDELTFTKLYEWFNNSSSLSDIVLNLLLFIPLGFSLANIIKNNNYSKWRSLFIITIISLGLSLTVESLQLFLPGRTSTPIDLLTNTLSGLFGGLIYQNIGNLLIGRIEYFFIQIRQIISIQTLTLFFLTYFILICWLSIPLQNINQLWGLNNWNTEFPLILGNELTGDRPWEGKINQFCFIKKIALNQDIKQIILSEKPCNYFSVNQTMISDKVVSDLSPILINSLTQRLLKTSEFTLAIQLATADTDQTGPARILSISKDLFQRNLTIGQWRSHLSIRLRTPVTGNNGTRPEFIIPNVFSDLKKHTILLIYNPFNISVFIDNIHQEYEFFLTPEMAWFWQLSPVRQGSIHLNSSNLLFYKILYYGLLFFPLGWCLGLILKGMKGKFSFYLLLISSGVIIPAVIFELLLSLQGARMISGNNLLLSISIIVIACSLNCRMKNNRVKVQ
ncbi:MAG: VanZ family protein [Microcoleaceae cyanobacterium]